MTRRSAEEELLAIGAEYERALMSYRLATPAGKVSREPKTLEELLKDQRFPTVKRHLRQIYYDPLTGSKSWGVVQGPNGVIAGIYSLAEGVPIKKIPSDRIAPDSEINMSYKDWVFMAEQPLRTTGP